MKTFLKVILGLFLIIVLGVASVFYFTRGVVDVGDQYFDAVANDDMDAAYEMTATAFQSEITKQAMGDYLASHNLTNVADTNWSSRSISGGTGTLIGTVLTSDGGSVPVEMSLVKEDGQWRIHTVLARPASIGTAGVGSPELPSERDQIALVNEVSSVFARSIAQGDMQLLYDHISEIWKGQTTPEELASIFSSFTKFGESMLILEKAAPQFDGPATIGSNGIMEISGRYVTGPDTTTFKHKYVYEGLGWKLFGLSLQVVPTEQNEQPAGTEPSSG